MITDKEQTQQELDYFTQSDKDFQIFCRKEMRNERRKHHNKGSTIQSLRISRSPSRYYERILWAVRKAYRNLLGSSRRFTRVREYCQKDREINEIFELGGKDYEKDKNNIQERRKICD